MSLITVAANATRARLLGADRDTKLKASDLLSYLVDGYERTDTFKNGHWDGRSSFFEFRDATFPAGFAPMLAREFKRDGHKVRLVRKKLPEPLGLPLEKAYAAVNPFEYDPRYEYQLETVRRLEHHGQIIARIATGGGKSMVARTAVKRLMLPTLFLTTRGVLMHQMKAGFEEAGFTVGVIGDGDFAPKRGVNVAMIQTLVSKLTPRIPRAGQLPTNLQEIERTRKLLQLFRFAILEEAHEVGGEGYFEVMNALVNCNYRLALTATPFMRDDEEANLRLQATSGEIAIDVTEKELIDKGILARPIFSYAQFDKNPKLKRSSGWQRAYKLGITEHAARNAYIVETAKKAREHGVSTMVLIQREAHGQALAQLMKQAGIKARFINGKHDQDQRQRALNELKAGKIDVLIGSTILDVGVDVPAVGVVILAGGGKAEVALRQRIGRGLRSKKSGPNVCFVLDFLDRENRYLRDHYKERRLIVEKTPGFVENVLEDGQDFPWEMLSAAKAA